MSTSQEQMATRVASLRAMSGKSTDGWKVVLGGSGLPRHGPKGCLEASVFHNPTVGPRIRVSDGPEVGEELIGWLEKANEEAP